MFVSIPGLRKGSDVCGILLWSICSGCKYLLRTYPGSGPYDGKYKRSCQEKRVFDSPKEGHPRKNNNILCFSYIFIVFFIQRERVRMLTRSSYLQAILYVLGQENAQVLYLLEHVRRKICVFFEIKT